MRKGDFIWLLSLGLIAAFLLVPATGDIFRELTDAHPYVMGFIKFAILATMGELMAIRITRGKYVNPGGLHLRAIIWGFLGVVIVAIFGIFANGVKALMAGGLLPFEGNTFAFAFFTSTLMNLTFAPTMMAFHRVTDTLIDLGSFRKLDEALDRIDWKGFVRFVVMKTIPFFWIPAHTVTFMLPGEYRVLVAAFLSIALGAILAFAKKKNS